MEEASDIADATSLQHLLEASGCGDRRAFADLYQLTASRLYPIAVRMLGRRDAADDVLQEAYVRIWRKATGYDRDRGRPLPWMAAIVRNCALDRLRLDNREPRASGSLDTPTEPLAQPRPALPKATDADGMAIRRCLEGLNEHHRKAILLAYYYGLTHEELSVHLSSPLGTVKSWVRRGLLHLKDCLER